MKLTNANFKTKKEAIQHIVDGKSLWDENGQPIEFNDACDDYCVGGFLERNLMVAPLFSKWQVEEVWKPKEGEWLAIKHHQDTMWLIDRFITMTNEMRFKCHEGEWYTAKSLESFNE